MIYLLVGNSGSGKSTQASIIEKNKNFKRIITYTTRDMRSGEIDGVDYNFVSFDEFKNLERDDKLLAITNFAQNFYGVPKDEILDAINNKRDVLLIVDYNGVRDIKSLTSDVVCIYLKLSYDGLLRRMEERGDRGFDIDNRMRDNKDFSNYADYIIDGSKSYLEIEREIDKIIGERV